MPRLPDVTALGGRPTPRATRGVPKFKGAGAGVQRAADIFAQQAGETGTELIALGEAVGGAVETFEVAEARRVEREIVEADAAWTTGLIGVAEKYRNDQDHATLAERYGADVEKLRSGIAENLSPLAQETFERTASVDAARASASMASHAQGLAMDATRAWLDTSLADFRRAYLEAPDAATREQALAAARASIAAARVRGAIDREAAGAISRSFAEDAAIGGVTMLPPAEQVAVLSSDEGMARFIDPARRATMLREARTRRDVGLRHEVGEAIAILETGLFPANLELIQGELAGNPDLADMSAELAAAVEDRDFMADFNRLPVATQFARVSALETKGLTGGITTRELRLLRAMSSTAEARLAEIEAAARERHAAARPRVEGALAVLDAGFEPPGLAELRETLRGDRALADFSQVLEAAVEDAEELANFAEAPPRIQALHAAGLAEQETLSPRELRRFGRMTRVLTAQAKAIETDALGHAAAIGVVELNEVDLADPQSLAERADKAAQAALHFDVAVSPLRPGEIAILKERLATATPDQAAAIFATLTQGLGDAGAGALAGEIAGDDPALAVAVHLALDRPDQAARIIHGQRLADANTDVRPTDTEMREAIATVYGRIFEDVPGSLAAFVEAAAADYAARKVPTGDFEFDEDLFKQSLRAVAGEPVDFNRQPILPPVPGMEAGEIEDLLAGLSPRDLEAFGNGQPVFEGGEPFDASMFETGDAQLVTIGVGRYRVRVEGLGYLLEHRTGAAYEIDLRAAVKAGR